MSWLVKDPQSIRSAAGLEWRIWKRLPLILLVGTALPALAWMLSWWLTPEQPGGSQDPAALKLQFILIGVVVLHWTAVLTVGIGCIVVMLMKGPHYTADSYPVSHSDQPLPPGTPRR